MEKALIDRENHASMTRFGTRRLTTGFKTPRKMR